jgi:DNA-binding response OmpR family regulator
MKNVVVIDDDPMIRNLLRAVLESDGYTVRLADNGKSGIQTVHEVIASQPLTLIVLDVIMPGMNGFDVLSVLKEDKATKDIPVVMLTGEDKAEDIIAGYSTGADYYITKPFTRQQLLSGIERLLHGDE